MALHVPILLCSPSQWLPCTRTPRPDYAIRPCPMSPSLVNDPSTVDEPAYVFILLAPRTSVIYPLLSWRSTNIRQLHIRTKYYSKILFGGYQCLVVSLGFRALLRFRFTAIVVVVINLYLLPLPPLYTVWPLIKEKPSDDAGVRLDVPTSRRECPSHCFSVIQPSCVVCKLLPVLQKKQSSCQEPDCRSTSLTSMLSRKPSPITLTRRQRPFAPSAHASSPSC